jgi:hypothetical protein
MSSKSNKAKVGAAPAPQSTALEQANPPSAHVGLTLLEVADPADLKALEADPRIRPFLVRILSERHAAVLPGSHTALLEALKKAGHTPKVQASL